MTKKEEYLHDAISDIEATCESIEFHILDYYNGDCNLKELINEIKSEVKGIINHLDKFKGEK